MKNLRLPLLVVLALVAIAAAGCSGSGTESSSELPSGTPPSVLAPSGALEPGDVSSGDDEADEGDDVADVADVDDDDAETSGADIDCEFDKTVNAEVGHAYSQTLGASGGSGDFRFEATSLPKGLSLSSSGQISGKPEVAGEFKASIEVIDIQSADDEHCTIRFTIRETISVRASVETSLDKSTPMIWKLTVSGTADANAYRWSFAPSANLCGSANEGAWKGKACPSPVSTGKTVFLWMQRGLFSNTETKVTATVSSNFADTASTSVTFPANPLTIMPGLETVVVNPVALEGTAIDAISVQIKTGWMDKAGSNCTVRIQYAEKASGPWKTLTEVADDFSKDEIKPLHPVVPEGMTSKHQYFKVTLTDESCGENSGWNLQGLSIVATYADDTSFNYKNPCLYTWLKKGESLRFGPNDTAVCAITTTGGGKDNETDDSVYLLIKKHLDAPAFEAGSSHLTDRGSTSIFLDASEMAEISAAEASEGVKEQYVFLKMDSYEYNDRQQDRVTAYGDYIFDSDPFVKEARLLKEDDSDSWVVDALEVFIFNPATIMKGGSMDYGYETNMGLNLDNDSDSDLLQQDPLTLETEDDSTLLIPSESNWTSVASVH